MALTNRDAALDKTLDISALELERAYDRLRGLSGADPFATSVVASWVAGAARGYREALTLAANFAMYHKDRAVGAAVAHFLRAAAEKLRNVEDAARILADAETAEDFTAPSFQEERQFRAEARERYGK